MSKLILIRGMHCKVNGTGPKDWKKCFESLKDNYIKYFPDSKIDFYIQTYDSPHLSEILETLRPIRYISYPVSELGKRTQTENFFYLLKLVDTPQKYDQILVTRFDIIYKKPVTEWNLDKESLMVPFQQPKGGINDCIHVFPGELLPTIAQSVEGIKSKSLHGVRFPRVKFMFDKEYYSDTDYPDLFPLNANPLYVLHRVRRWGFKNRNGAIREANKQKKKGMF